MSRIPALAFVVVAAACGTLESSAGPVDAGGAAAEGGAVDASNLDGGEDGATDGDTLASDCGAANLFCDDFEAPGLDPKWLPASAGVTGHGDIGLTKTKPLDGAQSLRVTMAKPSAGDRAELYRPIGAPSAFSVRLSVLPSLDAISSTTRTRIFALQRTDTSNDGIAVVVRPSGGVASTTVEYEVELSPADGGGVATTPLASAKNDSEVCFALQWDGKALAVQMGAFPPVTVTPSFVPAFLYLGASMRTAASAAFDVTYDDVAAATAPLACP